MAETLKRALKLLLLANQNLDILIALLIFLLVLHGSLELNESIHQIEVSFLLISYLLLQIEVLLQQFVQLVKALHFRLSKS